MKDSKVALPYSFTELIIVPDNLLWYVPFEALHVNIPVGNGQAGGYTSVPLITKLKIRYAPTVALAVADKRPRRPGGNTAVVVGRLYPQDSADVSLNAYREMEPALIGPVAVRGHLHTSSGLLAALFDRLVVLAEVAPPEKGLLDWSPVPLDQNSPTSTLNFWMALPWTGPEQVILPGFRTPAENALKKNPHAGADMFLAVTGLMASGARTVLISRWRTGGQSSYDLVREFVQELPHTTASDAWQRSVFLLNERPINPELEPRIVTSGIQKPPLGTHPFFWAGFLLADTGAPPKAVDPPTADELLKPQVVAPAGANPAAPNPAGQPPAPGAANPPAPPVLGNQAPQGK